MVIKDMFAEVFSYDQELIDAGIEKGIEQGIEIGEQKTEQTIKQVFKLLRQNKSSEEIKAETGITDEKFARYKADFNEIFQ